MLEGSAITLAGQLLLAIAAGVLLNLTPCVLPAIPVKIRTIVHEAGGAARQRVLAAVVFTAGTLLFFLGLGAATATLHWTWGALFQSPVLLMLLIAVLVGFAAITFRDVGIPVPQLAYRVRGQRHVEPFLSGLFSALLATPCTGPFLGGVLAFAVTRPPAVIIAIFLAVGLGLALPYVVLLMRPSLLDRLPKAGAWAERVRQGLAFVLLAAAVFFAQSLVPDAVTRWLWAAWLGLLVAWVAYVLARSTGVVARAVAVGFLAAGVTFVHAGGLILSAQDTSLPWRPMARTSWQQARSAGRPVLVEYTADWCINCKVLEKSVYADPRVIAAVHDNGVITLQADLTRPNPWLEQWLVAHGGIGLPFTVVLDATGEVVARFAGLFTTDSLVQAINDSTRSEDA